jgi:transposase IS166 family protein
MLPAPLPDLDGLDPEALKALLIAKHNESIEQHKQLRSNSQEIEHLKLVIEKYRRMIFGRKSEKLTRELEQLELRLANRQFFFSLGDKRQCTFPASKDAGNAVWPELNNDDG